ncbi:hypothetical protein GCM10009069_09110 [Algimonas arctica]|uniref:Uncharacterized protein n=1 Tax=Algimonas arctica TaxID=1479486 RepID=A0A8J3G1Q6_9PROT|nr:hypothetical protein [Algimonas arctica]GHA88333.1 hypothetical protein GCM10009069_09110 [Algimonas arctica]
MTYRSVLLGASILMIAGPALAGPTSPSYVPDLLPPNPVAGECYGRVEIPAQYETTTQRVLTREAHQRVLVQQPQLQATTERVLVKEPSVRYVVRQPTYATVTEQVLTRPGFDKLSVSEPSFQTVTETLHTGRPRLVWKRGNPTKLRAQGYKIHSTADAGVGGRGYSSTTQYGQSGGERCGSVCEIWCLVEEPGESVAVTRQVLSHSGQVHRTPVPAQYQSIVKQVVTDPGGVQKIPVPGEYRDLHVEKLVHPGGTATINVPAEYGHAQGRKLVSEARYEWRRIVCKPNTQHTVHRQSSLHAQPIGHSSQTYVTQQPIGYGNSHLSSGGHSQALAATTAYSSGTTTRYTHPTPKSPYQGTLTQSQPAYTSRYQSTSTTQGVTYSGQGSTTVSSAYPDRTYSGPAYVDPAHIDPRTRQVLRYESRHEPSRLRR